MLFIGLQTTMMMSSMDSTIVATALPTIASELGGFSRITWVVAVYSLAMTVSMPIHGKLGDLYGRRRTLTIAIVLFTGASLACGSVNSLDGLIVARFIQGLGAGGLGTLSMTALADVFPARELARWIGYQGVMYAISSISGPLIGGLFVDHLDWRWVFWINLPLGLFAVSIVMTHLQNVPNLIGGAIDWVGACLMTVGLSALLLVVTLGTGSLNPSTTIVLIFGVGVTAWLFVRHESRTDDPVLPMRLFSDTVVRVSVGLNAMSGTLIWCGIFFIPLFMQEVRGLDPTVGGLTLIPLMLGAAGGTLLAGMMTERTGRLREWLIIGSILMTLGVALLVTVGPDSNQFIVGAWACLLGLGIGLVMQPALLAAQNSAAPHEVGVVTSTVMLSRTIGASIGIPVFGGVMNVALGGRDGDPAAFVGAIRWVFVVAVVLGLVSVIMSMRLPDRPLRLSLGSKGAVPT